MRLVLNKISAAGALAAALACAVAGLGAADGAGLAPPPAVGGARRAGSAADHRRAARARWVMGTMLSVEALGPAAAAGAQAALDEVERLDRVLSHFRPESELSRLNRRAASGAVRLSKDLWDVLSLSARVHAESGGAFDPAVASGGRFASVRLDPARRSARYEARLSLEMGGVGKGYALDRAADLLRAAGVRSALLDFGGQVLALGAPAGEEAWEVLLEDGSARLRLRDASVSVSSQRENPGHILDPVSGRPARGSSVAVIAPSAAAADAWSTALFVAGIRRLPPGSRLCALELAPPGPGAPGAAPPAPIRRAGLCDPYLARPSDPDAAALPRPESTKEKTP